MDSEGAANLASLLSERDEMAHRLMATPNGEKAIEYADRYVTAQREIDKVVNPPKTTRRAKSQG